MESPRASNTNTRAKSHGTQTPDKKTSSFMVHGERSPNTRMKKDNFTSSGQYLQHETELSQDNIAKLIPNISPTIYNSAGQFVLLETPAVSLLQDSLVHSKRPQTLFWRQFEIYLNRFRRILVVLVFAHVVICSLRLLLFQGK